MDKINSDNYRLVFIIAHKYYKGYESYVEYYVNNINKFYDNATIIIVDNNSLYKDDIFNSLKQYKNVILLENNIDCKFELGAYQVGLKYMLDNNMLNKYDYCIFSQDTFVLKNKYDFNILSNNNVKACSITSWYNDWAKGDVWSDILFRLNLYDKFNESRICWCNTFILHKDNFLKIYEYLKKIVITTRHQSEASERYLGRILLELNNGFNYDIDGDIDNLSYYCHTVNIFDNVDNFFCKKAQQKNEKTLDKI